MNDRLQSLLCECGWTASADNPNFTMAPPGHDNLRTLASALDASAKRPKNGSRRSALEAARDEAAALGWPAPRDWRAEFAAFCEARDAIR